MFVVGHMIVTQAENQEKFFFSLCNFVLVIRNKIM